MKKILTLFTLLALLIAGGQTTISAQSLTKQQEKAIQKDVKKRTKELKKANWEPLASTQTMEYALLSYRTYIEADPVNRIPVIGIALGQNNKIGRDNAMHAGITNYAARAKAQVVGKLKSVASSDANKASQEEIDRFGEAYESAVNAKLSSLVREHFALVRVPKKEGTKEYNVFMSIDETAARKAREEAARAAKEQASLGDLSTVVEEFIGEPVPGDE
ncbi:MAG: hypothetical protein NC187_04040 [Candidatus Amulumruptor caecigallinarius]|nr:hypothetical protein [Candidatus Amulumruptor caecigallinarius]MCM1396642.1 hypothetical protein [Candidatus Amulumruptor caecigallinarius]MCM1453300.1 hypothetical protein [bacterium]